MLSDKVQQLEMEKIGFPISIDALDNIEAPEWWNGDYEIAYDDGTTGYVPLHDISASDRQKLINYCKTVTEQAYIDDNIFRAISEGGKNYILGDETIEETVALIENKISLHAAE